MTCTAILLCAGEGSRIRSVTKEPKCLLEIAGRPLVEHQLAALAAAGIDRAIIVTGYKSDALQARIRAFNTDVRIEFTANPDYKLLGNSHSLLLGLQAAKTDVVVFDGDLLFDPAILMDFVSSATNAFAVGPGSVDDVECAKALCDADGVLKKLIDKRTLTRAELETYHFAGEAMGIIHLDDTLRKRLIATALTFFETPENGIKNWEFLFTLFFETERMYIHQTENQNWIEIDDRADFDRARQLFESVASA